ncbi:glycosyltransferase family 2 protein [Thermosynechococcus vestitus]|uniref:glycosyltransferase family 2 protein n=1 Tax=Thermosynechococcus vestitus TaxID=146786 RepID=UPI0013E8DCD1|nr:glycosyltransferase family A protein [Thermosynechococcus vestitus]
MDDTAIIRTYGKKNLPDGTTDRPLVTFAVFAYNQEKYIREAVEDAFAQTYSPLEIILSDDCSSDGTFEIMKQMACEYRGPHRVLVRQSELNFGTALHVSAVAKMACGELLVVAAGDDVSFPHRVEMLVEKWLKSNKEPVLLHSAMIQVSEECPEARRTLYIKDDNKVNLECYLSGNPLPFLPPTFAYSKILFSQFPPMIGGSIIEDGPLDTVVTRLMPKWRYNGCAQQQGKKPYFWRIAWQYLANA